MMKVWPVKHSPLLRQPERFIARDELKSLIQKVTHSLVNIHDKTGKFLLRLDDGRVIDTKGWAGWEWTHGVGLYGMGGMGDGRDAAHGTRRDAAHHPGGRKPSTDVG